jgi:hypothetical protein
VQKFKHREGMKMLSDDFLTRIFSNEEMQKIPIGCQSTAVHAFEEVLEQIKEENPYGSISELFEPTFPTTV